MYKVFCDGQLMYDPRSKDLSLIEPTLELALNSAGSFSFSMPQKHPFYDEIENMKSVISVERDGVEIFAGRVVQPGCDFYNTKSFVCEGELAYLNDTIQRHKEYHNISVENYLKDVISIHNAQVDASKQFTVGNVTVVDSNNSLYKISSYENTWQLLNDKLLGTYGGYFFIRKVNGVRYLDYLAEMPGSSTQVIKFGRNLLDFSSNIELTDIATALIPLGATNEETNEKLTVASVNNGSDVIVSDEAIAMYGYICKTNEWSDVTLASNLLRKGQEYLSSIQWENMLLNVRAVDLHDLNADIDEISLGDEIRVCSYPHGLDRFFPVSAMSIKLDNPADNEISLGIEVSANKQTMMMANIESTVSEVSETVEDLEGTVGDLESSYSSITKDIDSITLEVGKKIESGDVVSAINLSTDAIEITSNGKLLIDTSNFNLDDTGFCKTNSLQVASGVEIGVWSSGGKVLNNKFSIMPVTSMNTSSSMVVGRRTCEFDTYVNSKGFYENGTALSSKYLSASGTASDSSKLSGSGGYILVGANSVYPSSDNTLTLGYSARRFEQLYAGTATINTSDRNQKKCIENLDEKHVELFERLMPVSFQFIDGTSGRTHIGFISQDVEDAMNEVGLSDLDFAGFCKDEITDEDGSKRTIYGLRYSEFIALNTMMIQKTRNELSNLKEILQKKGVI